MGMDTRTAIINAVAKRQAIYYTKRARSFDADNEEGWARNAMAVEVCAYVLDDVLRALGYEPIVADPADNFIIEEAA
jgi:hypothetical protein